MGKGFKYVMLNVRSLWPNIDELKLNFHDYDIIGLCETWLNCNVTDSMIAFPGFDIIRQDRTNHKRGGGLLLYVKNEIFDCCSKIEDLSMMSTDLEQLWVTLCIPNVRKTNIALVYRPPGSTLENSINELRGSLETATTNNNFENIITGDFNINYKLRHSHPYKLLKEIERDFGLKQLIDQDTRITARSSTLIDLILTDCQFVLESGVLDVSISDHCAVYMIKKKPRLEYTRVETKCRSYKKYVKIEMQNSVETNVRRLEFWENENNIDMMWETLLKLIEECANIHCPFVQAKIPDNSPIWFTREIVDEILYKDFLYSEAKRLGTDDSWNDFRLKKKEVKKLIQNAKEVYVQEQLDSQHSNPRKFWRNINSLSGLGKSSKKSGLTKIFDKENNIVLENQDAADYMNNYYVNAGPTLAKEFVDQWSENVCNITSETTFDFAFVTEDQIMKLVKNIDIGKSSAIDTLSSKILKDSFEVLTLELTQLYNECLSQGYFPKAWTLGIVTPIPKVNVNNRDPKNWRPISQIQLPGKLLERIVHTQLVEYLSDSNILNDNQHGFRTGKSTTTAIFDSLKLLFENWNSKLTSCCIYIDFSKAFDCLDHNILLSKLKLYGLNCKCQAFMLSYIKNRHQCTKVNGYTSSELKLTYGTAQGSILGPLLFILYVNDLFKEINNQNSVFMYADDTLLLNSGKTRHESIENSQQTLNIVSKWCELNKMSINISKTKFMLISPSTNDCTVIPSLYINDTKLSQVHVYEYLGVQIDDKLTMRPHIDKVCKNVQKKYGILRKIRKFICEETALLIYKVMIRPHFDYGDYLIDSGLQKNIEKLERIQDRVVRTIEYKCGMNRCENIDTLKTKYNIEKLRDRRKRNLLKIMFGHSHNTENIDYYRPERMLRSSKKVKIKSTFTRITKIQKSPFYRGISLWDSLPFAIQHEQGKTAFKNALCRLDITVL